MDDFLDERDQWDALKGWLKENGAWIIAGVLIGVGTLYGWRWWENSVTTRAQTAAARYSDVLDALNRNDRNRADQLAQTLASDFGGTPYADQARLMLARHDVDIGKFDDAVQKLAGVASGSDDDELRNIARLRLARVQLMQKKPDEALATLAKGDPGAFAAAFEEARGDALLAKGDPAGALAAYRKAADTAEPGSVDEGLLQLKITDLAPAQAQAASPDAVSASVEAQEAPKESQK